MTRLPSPRAVTARRCPSLRSALAGLALLACGASLAGQEPPRRPTAEQLRQALNTTYVTPKGQHQECLGRLVFDVPRNMEWGLSKRGEPREYVFTYDVRDGGERVSFGRLHVFMTSPATRKDLEYQRELPALLKKNAVHEARKEIESSQRIIQKIAASKDNPEEGNDEKSRQAAIEELKKDIKNLEDEIANVDEAYRLIDIGIPDSVVYKHGGIYVYRDHKLFRFEGSGYADPPEGGKNLFLETVKSFRYRKLYEIPRERGVCFPFGFLPDDGTMPFDVKLSLRYADRPNVLYTIGTGIVGTDYQPVSEPTALMAATRANIGRDPGPENEEAARRLLKRIEAHDVMIGALPAQQGGIAVNTADPGKPVTPNYSVYTGYGGWKGSQVLPFITVEMRSFTREQERTFKTDPPPFEESLQRLDALLKSIRLRPTEPPMPELAQ